MSQAGKGHVPEENLPQYRKFATLARRFNSLSGLLWTLEDYKAEAAGAEDMSEHFWEKANELRVDL